MFDAHGDAVRTNVLEGVTSVCVVTDIGGSSSESAAAAACQFDGCALCPEPTEPPAGTGPSGGGAPLRGKRHS